MGAEPPYVDYNSFELDPAVSGGDFSIVAYMLSRYYSATPRYTTSAFMRLKRGANLAERALAPHMFGTLPEARAFIASREDNVLSLICTFQMRGTPTS
jgi:hypothetical protein